MQQVLQDYEIDEELEYMKSYHSLAFEKVNVILGKAKTSSSMFLFISDFNIALFSKKFFSKKLRLEFSSLWTEVQEIRYNSGDNQYLSFKAQSNSFRIVSKNTKEVADLIMKFNKSVWGNQDAPTPRLYYPKEYEMPEYTKSIPIHLKYELFQKGIQLPNRQISSLAKFFASKPTEFKFDHFYWLIQYIPNVIKIINWEPSIKKIIIPLDVCPHGATLMQNIMKKNKTIQEISFSNGTITNLPELLQTIDRNQESKIKGLHFTGITFTSKDLHALDSFVRNYKLDFLTLNLAFDHSLSLNFTEDSLKIENFGYLQTLVLDNTPGLNLQRIFLRMKNLKFLSIVNCGIEVNEIIRLFQVVKGSIERINASYNKCTVPIRFKKNKLIKTNTKYLNISNINWSEKDLVQIWNFFSLQEGLALDLSSATLSDGSFDNFVKQAVNVDSKISELYWNDNLSTGVTNIIKHCPNLSVLSIARVFGEDDPEINKICKFIKKTETLKKLNISGSRRKFIGKNMPMIFESIQENTSITNLDIRKNHAGESFPTDVITCFMKNQTVEILGIEGNEITDTEKYKEIFSQLQGRTKPLLIVWPQKEIDGIALSTGTEQDELDQLMDLHARLANIGQI